jgi:hypothetical protein
MKSRQISDRNGERIFVVVYEAGEAFHEPLVSLANQNHLGSSQFTAIGAFRSATIGYFERERRDYTKLSLGEQVESVRLNNLCVRVEIMTLPSDSVPRGDSAPYRTSISVSCADPSNRVLFVFLGAPLY